MTARTIPVEDFDLVVFGATGDLAQRKLLPALYFRDGQGQIPDGTRIIGSSRRAMSREDFQVFAKQALQNHVEQDEQNEDRLQRFAARLDYIALDPSQEAGWGDLAIRLKPREQKVRVFYLAVGPDLFAPICEKLGEHRMVTPKSRVVVEKPVGTDGASAEKLNDRIGRIFAEPAIYRIDHYLGKETVQNLMALRFANALFEPLWNSAHIDHVQITVAETLGLGERAGYYDKAGALRDMVQNHMLQLLCLTAMEPPTSIEANAVRDEKLKVLQSLVPIIGEAVAANTVRGQYKAGASEGTAVPGYAEELGSDISKTETFVALKLEIGSWRWAGVPFYLRTGKRLGSRMSEIVVGFKPIPYSVFDQQVGRHPDAYERLLMDVVRGNQTLFMRRDEVAAAWRFIDPILDYWRDSPDVPKPYVAGSWGPAAAVAMIERDGRTWDDGEG